MVAGCSCACGDSLFLLSTSTKAQSSSQNSHDHYRFYQFQSISPPFVASCTARVGSHTDNNVFVKFFGCIAGDSMETARPRAVSSMPNATRASRLQSRLDYNRRALIDHFEQFDHVLVTHPHAAVTRRHADFVLVFGAMNVDEAVARVRVGLI